MGGVALHCFAVQSYYGHDPFNQNFGKFRSKTQWISSVQPEKFLSTGPLFEVDQFSRSDRSEFWLNGSHPMSQQFYPLLQAVIWTSTKNN